MSVWQPIETAPTDGTWITGKLGPKQKSTQWGKASHIPLYGWCFVSDANDGDPVFELWQPTLWRPHGYSWGKHTAEEIDEIARAMCEADGLEPDNPSYGIMWSNYQLTARRYVAAHEKLIEIEDRTRKLRKR